MKHNILVLIVYLAIAITLTIFLIVDFKILSKIDINSYAVVSTAIRIILELVISTCCWWKVGVYYKKLKGMSK